MVDKFLICASVLLLQTVSGHVIPLQPNLLYGLGDASAASSAASAAALQNAAEASAAAASAAAAEAGTLGLAASRAPVASAAGSAGGALTGLSDYNIVYSGPLLVTSSSPLYPNGVFVSSENTLEGPLLVNSALPFLSAINFEGSFPTAGSGVTTCGCGSGSVGITNKI